MLPFCLLPIAVLLLLFLAPTTGAVLCSESVPHQDYSQLTVVWDVPEVEQSNK